MDIQTMLEEVLSGNSSQWTQTLTKLGFSGTEAPKFLTGLMDKLGGLLKGGKLDLSKALDPKALADKLDVNALASQVGIDTQKARKGVDGLMPGIVQALQGQLGSLSVAGKAGGLGAKVAKLFGK